MVNLDDAYRGTPPWDIPQPQPAVVALAEAGAVQGSALDAASLGHETWGVDSSPMAIERARHKALGRTFDTVTDSGPFHIFGDEERSRYALSLAQVLGSGSKYLMLCFSDRQPGSFPLPRRITQQEIHAAFADGWRIDEIVEARFAQRFFPEGTFVWRCSITRL